MKKSLLFLICIALIGTSLLASEQTDEANASFTYKGKPIHPFLLHEFSNWLSDDRPPMITTVDVAAAFDTNKYQQSTIQLRDGCVFVERREEDKGVPIYESFDYQRLGKMANGIHVLETTENGGGSGFFMNLIFVRFSEGEIMFENKNEKQLLMSIVGTYRLGDRYEGKVEVFPNRVLIHASPKQFGGGSIEEDVELKFPKRVK